MGDTDLWLYKIVPTVVVFLFWAGLIERSLNLGLYRPDLVRLRTLFQLDAPERYRKYVPERVFENQRKQLFQFLAIAVAIVASAVLLLYDEPQFIEKFHSKLFVMAFAGVLLNFAITFYSWNRKPICDLGPNKIQEEVTSAGFAFQTDWLRWFCVVVILIDLTRAWLSDPRSSNPSIVFLLLLSFRGFGYSTRIRMFPNGISDAANFTSWNEIVAYHWYPERQGVLIVRDAGLFKSPLTIIPVSPDKADEVERLLNEYLPGNRGEDVDVAVPSAVMQTTQSS